MYDWLGKRFHYALLTGRLIDYLWQPILDWQRFRFTNKKTPQRSLWGFLFLREEGLMTLQ